MGIPTVEKMEIYPVAGHDCMELNLSGAHAPYFTRNIVILTDSNGVEGVGEVPGGEKITKALEDVKHLVLGTRIADYKQTLNKVRAWLSATSRTMSAACRPSTCAPASMWSPPLRPRCWT